MNNNKSTPATFETLSAYLDDQLPEVEAQVLRHQLAEDADLRSQLDALRQSRYILGQTPKLKPRRSFVLTSEIILQQKRVFRAMNISRMISVAASVLLVVALGGQYLFMGSSAAPAADMVAMENYQASDEAMAEEPMFAMEAPAEIEMLGEEPAEESPAAEPDVTEEGNNLGEPPDPDSGNDDPASEPSEGGGLPPEEATIQALEDAVMSETPDGTQRSIYVEKDSETDLNEGEMGGEAVPEEELVIPPQTIPPSGRNWPAPLRVLQSVLLLLVVVSGLTAAYYRKKLR